MEHIERAISLYAGPFLSTDVDTPWLTSMRERQQKKYLANLKTQCKAWCQGCRKADTRALLEQAKTHEPEAENIYQTLFGE